MVCPGGIEGLLQHPAGLVVQFLLTAIVQLTLPPSHRSGIITSLGCRLAHSCLQHSKDARHGLHKGPFLLRPLGSHKQDLGGKDGPPGGQLPHLGKRAARLGRQLLAQGRVEGPIDRRKIDDGRRDNPPAGHNIGAENGQIEVGVREKDAVENLQSRPQPGGFKMQLAQTLTVM